ncbi:hypothetical protein BSY16_1915 [Sinorhizobium sp. RAC02]|jgi:hypothetical protein|nr:hypothetical protein BSY16_1915 [Sinorhizobium sp. RAC02]
MRRHKREIKSLLERVRILARQDGQDLLQYIVAMALCENCPAYDGEDAAHIALNDNGRT